MIQKDIQGVLDEIEFVKRAAGYFSKDEKLATYTDGEIMPECLFAVRWGLGDDCVLVFRIGEDNPAIYKKCISKS